MDRGRDHAATAWAGPRLHLQGLNGGEAQQGRVEREAETKDARRPAIPALPLTHVKLKESKNSRKLEAYLLT